MKKIIVIVISVLCVGFLLAPQFCAMSYMNAQHREVDVYTGDTRVTRYWWYIAIDEKINPSVLNEYLDEVTIKRGKRKWVNQGSTYFGLGQGHSCVIDNMSSQARELLMWFELNKTENQESQELVDQFLTNWQNDDQAAARELLEELRISSQ